MLIPRQPGGGSFEIDGCQLRPRCDGVDQPLGTNAALQLHRSNSRSFDPGGIVAGYFLRHNGLPWLKMIVSRQVVEILL